MRIFLIAAAMLTFPFVFDVVQESPVYAEIVQDGAIYRDKMLRFEVARVSQGDIVEIWEDFSEKIYRVDTGDAQGWINARHLKIPEDVSTDMSVASSNQLEAFANEKSFESKTKHLLMVDIARQKLYIFEGKIGAWVLVNSFDCSTGTNTSPTTRGSFSLKDRGEWFYSYRLESGAKYWIRFNGHYLFHSIPMDKHKNILKGEDVVGIRRSNGCVRLLIEDMRWIYENISDGAAVVIL